MGLLEQVIAELDQNYGGIVQLDRVDQLKRNPEADAIPLTRYLTQRTAAEESEEEFEDDFEDDDSPSFSEKPDVDELLQSMHSAGESAASVLYDAVQNGLSEEDFEAVFAQFCRSE